MSPLSWTSFPSPTLSHPSRLSPSTGFGFPASYSQFPPATYFTNGNVYVGLPLWSAGKESVRNVGDLGSIPGLGRYPGEGKGYPLQYSGPENSMDCIVQGVAKSQTWLSDFHFQCMFQCYSLKLSQPLLPLCPKLCSLCLHNSESFKISSLNHTTSLPRAEKRTEWLHGNPLGLPGLGHPSDSCFSCPSCWMVWKSSAVAFRETIYSPVDDFCLISLSHACCQNVYKTPTAGIPFRDNTWGCVLKGLTHRSCCVHFCSTSRSVNNMISFEEIEKE